MLTAFQIILFLVLLSGAGIVGGKDNGKEDKNRGLSLSLAAMIALVATFLV